MTWLKEDKDLFDRLRQFPDVRMDTDTHQRIGQTLLRMELTEKRHTSPQFWWKLRSTLVGAAGVALLMASLFGSRAFKPQTAHRPQPGTTAATQPTPISVTVQRMYVGYPLPFEPLIPAVVPAGYALTNAEATFDYKRGAMGFDEFVATYTKAKGTTLGTPAPPTIRVFEAVGNSMRANHGGFVNADTNWTPLATVGQQTYYKARKSAPNTVGFVRDHVAYVIDGMMSDLPKGGMSRSQSDALRDVLRMAESITRVAPNGIVDVTGRGYDDALKNVQFRPYLPTAMRVQYKIQSILSHVLKTDLGTTQSLQVTYVQKHNPTKSIGVTEAPLHNADNTSVFPTPVMGYSPTWKDFRRGLEIRLSGNTSSAEFHRVLSLFQSDPRLSETTAKANS